MKNKLKFYEVDLWRNYYDEDGGLDGIITDYSMCIKGYFQPTIKEVEYFLENDIRQLGYEGVTRITEIEEKEVYDFFDTENIDNWPIFGKENKEMKEEIRIVDKAITLTEELIKLLDGDLRCANLKLAQEFDDNVSDLLCLKDQLCDIVNNFYNPPQKPEFAIVGYDKDNDVYTELYFSTDIQDVLQRAKAIKPLCDNDTLRNSEGEPYDYLEVVNRNNYDVLYWRSYESN